MARTVYALLVGIDRYSSPVPPLAGCVNDIRRVDAYLRERVAGDEHRYDARVLLDGQATREALIDGFRTHLRQAGPDDAALFYFSGHGSQEPAPPEFWALEPDRLNETLVCFDSRLAGGGGSR